MNTTKLKHTPIMELFPCTNLLADFSKFTQKNKLSFICYVMLINVLALPVLSVASSIDSTRPSNIPLSLNGEDCMQKSDTHKSHYDFTDENGLHCLCQLCRRGTVLTKNCTCDPNNLERPQESECRPVLRGQFMNASNFCSRGFECKKCPHPLEVRDRCRNRGPDTVCSCVDGYYMTSLDTCRPLPKCDAGYEPTPGYGHHGTEIRCTPCHEGFFQPNNNSTLICKKIRQCTVQEGTPRLDAVCLRNDQTLEPTHQPTNGYGTTTEPTESGKPVTAQVPTSRSDEITPVGPITCPITNNPGGPPNLNVLPWALCLFFFVLGIGVGYIIHRAYVKRGTHILPKESKQLMSGLEEAEQADEPIG